MNRDEYLERKRAGLPIESHRELVHALAELHRERTVETNAVWYTLNKFIRLAMGAADREGT